MADTKPWDEENWTFPRYWGYLMRAFETMAVNFDFIPDELFQFWHWGGISSNPHPEELLKLFLENDLEKAMDNLVLSFMPLCILKNIIEKKQ